MGIIREVIKSYAPMVVSLVVVVLLKTGLHHGRLNLALFALVVSEIALMLKTKVKTSELATEIEKLGWQKTEAEALEHIPRILVEILTRFLMPKEGNLALSVLYIALLVHNVFTYINGELETPVLVTGDTS